MASLSWLSIPSKSPFSIANIPFGIISTKASQQQRPAIAIGNHALDLSAFSLAGGFSKLESFQKHVSVFSLPTLNGFAALGRPVHRQVREYLQSVFSQDTPYPDVLKENSTMQQHALIPLSEVQNYSPLRIGDYTDFYAGINHAFNVGVLFRGRENALQPNYKHIPVGYHGRASSIVVSGHPIRRPQGQILADPTAKPPAPVLSPSKRLDIELELAAFVCTPNTMGTHIPISSADEHLFGLVMMNDWSARDIQAWEYVPLGPFNGKNFATTISPWVVLMDALEPFRCAGLEPGDRDSLLPYLRDPHPDSAYDIALEVDLVPKGAPDATTPLSRVSSRNLLFSFSQMLAHHSIGGCLMSTGDLLGSGTISGTEAGSLGSLLEMSKNGKEPFKLLDGSERLFLEDGDEVVMRGMCGQEGAYVGFGECRGVVLPAINI